jgi:hypothetical protein
MAVASPRAVAIARTLPAPLFFARTATRPPRDAAFARILFAISGSGTLAALGLLIAGDPTMAARAFCGTTLLLLTLVLAGAYLSGSRNRLR